VSSDSASQKKSSKEEQKAEHAARVRTKIQESMDAMKEQRLRDLFRKRLDVARTGVHSFQGKKAGESAKAFRSYLAILEEWKGVGPWGLHPGLFDQKKDFAELLLICGVYWDLAKVFDKTRNPKNHQECVKYLDKFIVFSKGLPHQVLAAETLRKYISNNKAIHRADFVNAYKRVAEDKCFVVTALVDEVDEATLHRLRDFRDEVLAQSWMGRGFVRGYYFVGPWIAAGLDRAPKLVRKTVAQTLDRVAGFVSKKRVSAHPRALF
jgi:hypothetical protein